MQSSDARPSSSQGSRRGSVAGGAAPPGAGPAPRPRRTSVPEPGGIAMDPPRAYAEPPVQSVRSQSGATNESEDMAYKVLQDLQVRLAQMQSQSQSFDQLAQHAHQGPGLALSAQNASSESSDPWMQRRRQLSQDCDMIEQSIMMLQRWGSLEPLARARLLEYLRKLPNPSADPRMLAGSSQAYGQDASLPRPSSFLPPGVEVSSGGAILPAPISPEEVDGQAARYAPFVQAQMPHRVRQNFPSQADHDLSRVVVPPMPAPADALEAELAQQLEAMTQFFAEKLQTRP